MSEWIKGKLSIDKVIGRKGEDLMREIRTLRDEYIHTTGREPNKIKMSYPTFTRIRDYAIENGYMYTRVKEFTREIDIKLYGMDLEFVDHMKGVELGEYL